MLKMQPRQPSRRRRTTTSRTCTFCLDPAKSVRTWPDGQITDVCDPHDRFVEGGRREITLLMKGIM